MTDLELMQILDENGYEPNIENLKILKENISLTEKLTSKQRGAYNTFLKSTKKDGYQGGEGNVHLAINGPIFKDFDFGEKSRILAHDAGKGISRLNNSVKKGNAKIKEVDEKIKNVSSQRDAKIAGLSSDSASTKKEINKEESRKKDHSKNIKENPIKRYN